MFARTISTTNIPIIERPPPAKYRRAPKLLAFTAETIDGQNVRVRARHCASNWSSAPGAVTGQAFLHCNTYRFHGHHVGDIDRSYYRIEE